MGIVRRRLLAAAPFLLSLVLTVALAPGAAPATGTAGLEQLEHLIVIYEENWSFDGLFGRFPGANGIANAGAAATQVNREGQPYATLPPPSALGQPPSVPDPRFPAALPNGPFNLAPYVPPDGRARDMVHRFYQEQQQINGGRMNQYVAWTDGGGLVMGYYDAADWPLGRLAQQYTLADNFFHAAYGGSMLNHLWLVCACTPRWPEAPAHLVAQLDADGRLVRDGVVSPDGYVVNQVEPFNEPHAPTAPDADRLPPLTPPTIGDRLSERGVSWAWYGGGWPEAAAGSPPPGFAFHHQPFNYFAGYAPNTAARAAHLKGETAFRDALRDGTLPAVAFVKPVGPLSMHPGRGSFDAGQAHLMELVQAIMVSPVWPRSAIVITFDEHGGRWDHVAPPAIDRWGPGTRVPTIVVSPFARRSYVDHTPYDTTSVLKLIETRWGLAPLGARDAAANDLTAAFDFAAARSPRFDSEPLAGWVADVLAVSRGLVRALLVGAGRDAGA
jgi:phospholipase C